jgi:hypothetical protein
MVNGFSRLFPAARSPALIPNASGGTPKMFSKEYIKSAEGHGRLLRFLLIFSLFRWVARVPERRF